MPIRAENRDKYPAEWKAIRERILRRAGDRCEGSPKYPDCRAENHKSHPVTHAYVVLTIGHLDRELLNHSDENLRAWCQRCHNAHDMPERARARKVRKEIEIGIRYLPWGKL